MKLHESIKVVLNQMGYQTLSSGVLINALGDFRALPSDVITASYLEELREEKKKMES